MSNPFNKTGWRGWSPDRAISAKKKHSTESYKAEVTYKDGSTLAERKNAGKVDLSLLPPAALEELAKVLEFGAKKYSRDGWKKGMLYSVCVASCLRHLFEMLKCNWLDEESGLPHAAHAMCNLAFLLEYQEAKRDKELNDL